MQGTVGLRVTFKFYFKGLSNIYSQHYKFSTTLECTVLDELAQKLPGSFVPLKDLEIPSNIKLADPKFNTPADIELIIGSDHFGDESVSVESKLVKNYLFYKKLISAGSWPVKCRV